MFFHKYQELRSVIEGKLTALLSAVSNESRTGRLRLSVEPGSLRVIVLSSAAGAAGSGAFLDMGYLAKILTNNAVRGAKVDLILMLPSAYTAPSRRSEANAYAALMDWRRALRRNSIT